MWAHLQRWRWALLVAAILVAGLVFALWPEPTEVDTGKVTTGEMSVGITDDGVTRAEEFYVVAAPVTGFLSRIELEPGDAVSRGALITSMTGRPSSPLDQRTRDELRGAMAAARAAEQGASASLAQSSRDLERAEALAPRGFVAEAQLEAARTRVATDRSAVMQAKAEIARIGAMLEASSGQGSGAAVPVRAPASGQVLSVINESEGVIAEGTPLVTIGNPDAIELVVDLLSREAVQVKPGDRVSITQWGGPDPLVGRVQRVEPFGKLKVSALGIEEQRVNVIIDIVDLSAAQAARLGHGYQVDATIQLWRGANVRRLPIGALFRGPEGQWQVFVVEGGRARERDVQIGHMNDEHAELLDGLEEGAEVVLNPGAMIDDGMRVSPRE